MSNQPIAWFDSNTTSSMSVATPFSFGSLTPPPSDWSEFYPDGGQRISARTSRGNIYDDNGPKSAKTGNKGY
jgi:hypothetical protein